VNIPDAGRAPSNEPTPPAQDAEGRFIPPPVTGYKPLTPGQIALLNRVKALGAEVDERIRVIAVDAGMDESGNPDPRCLAVARTEFQTAFMWLCRAITKPGTFA
jgi:hypothetical protein